jgi:hypothetical protein
MIDTSSNDGDGNNNDYNDNYGTCFHRVGLLNNIVCNEDDNTGCDRVCEDLANVDKMYKSTNSPSSDECVGENGQKGLLPCPPDPPTKHISAPSEKTRRKALAHRQRQRQQKRKVRRRVDTALGEVEALAKSLFS